MKPLKIFLAESDLATNKAFVNKIYKMAQPNPLDHREFYFGLKDKDDTFIVKFQLAAMRDEVHISHIIVAEAKTGKGAGTHVLKIITDEADKMGITLSLIAKPIKHAGSLVPKAKLVSIYKKYGFKVERGSSMYRDPKPK